MCKVIYTADERIPLADDDRGMENGWRCIPIPPTDDEGWIIVDDRSDRKPDGAAARSWARRGCCGTNGAPDARGFGRIVLQERARHLDVAFRDAKQLGEMFGRKRRRIDTTDP
jgi:hypothetical protein